MKQKFILQKTLKSWKIISSCPNFYYKGSVVDGLLTCLRKTFRDNVADILPNLTLSVSCFNKNRL